jgi:hypothetical protein
MFRVIEATAGTNYYISGNNLAFETNNLSIDYYTSIKDIGYIADVTIMIQYIISASQGLAWNSDSTRRFNDSQTLRFTGEEFIGNITFQIRTSSDNVTWSNWSTWGIADYTCRYFQIKATVIRASLTMEILLSDLTINVDLPDVDDFSDDSVSVAGDGKAVLFVKTYHEIPAVNIDILSGTGYVHQFSVAPSITGFTVKLYQLDGTAVVGNFRWSSHGV